jgi:metal-sulfur cluster biosynthetic enzyme
MATVRTHPVSAARGEPSGPIMTGGAACAEYRELVVNAVWNALTYVYESGPPLDLVSLGLVYDVRDEEGVIAVEMTLTAPGRTAEERMREQVRSAIAKAVGADAPVEVRVVWDPPWNPAMIDSITAVTVGLRVS